MPFEMPSEVTDMLGGTSVHESTTPAGPDVTNTLRQEPSGFGTPTVPALFRPGADSLFAQQDKSSFAQTLFTTLAAGGDDIPTFQKMQLAGLKAKLEVSQEQRAWATFHHSTDVFNESVRQDNIRAAAKFAEVRPFLKAQIRAANDEERPGLVELNAKLAESMQPGAGDYIRHYGNSKDNMAALDGMDLVLSDPASQKLFQPLLDTQGYQNFSQDPRVLAKGKILSHDVLSFLSTKLPADVKVKLHKGDMSEDELRSEFEKVMLDPANQMNAQEVSHAKIALDSETGQSIMANMGAVLGKSSVAQQMHAKAGGAASNMSAEQLRRFKQNEAMIADPATWGLTTEQVKDKQKENQILLKLERPENAPSQAANNLNMAIGLESKGKYSNMGEYLDALKENHTSELWSMGDRAQKRAAAMNPNAAMETKMATPHDMQTHPVFKMDKTGNVQPVKGDVSEREYRSGEGMFSMTPTQQTKWSELQQAGAGGMRLFDLADKAYKAKTATEQAAELLAEKGATFSEGTRAIAAAKYPDLVNYISQRNSALGKYARSLGGEVGVLTDQDIARVIQMFPTASDSAKTRAFKRRAFQQLIELNRNAITSVLTGNKDTANDGQVTPEQLQILKNDPKIQSKIQGIIGSVEGLRGENDLAPSKDNRGNSARQKLEQMMEQKAQ